MKLNQEQIKAIIPHRDPFLMIDEIIELESLKHATGIKYVKHSDPYFEGHFPSKPVMPGVLIIEALAQVGAVILLSHPDYQGKIAYFAGIKQAKFRKSVLPGDKLILKCELSRIKSGFGIGIATAYVNDQIACHAEITFAVS